MMQSTSHEAVDGGDILVYIRRKRYQRQSNAEKFMFFDVFRNFIFTEQNQWGIDFQYGDLKDFEKDDGRYVRNVYVCTV